MVNGNACVICSVLSELQNMLLGLMLLFIKVLCRCFVSGSSRNSEEDEPSVFKVFEDDDESCVISTIVLESSTSRTLSSLKKIKSF